jgi:hypothetical protein
MFFVSHTSKIIFTFQAQPILKLGIMENQKEDQLPPVAGRIIKIIKDIESIDNENKNLEERISETVISKPRLPARANLRSWFHFQNKH